MKAIIFSFWFSLVLVLACNNDKNYGANEHAIESARTYLSTQLGSDVTYEEGTWGKVEPRKVEWTKSDRYKLYQDTILMMQDNLRLMNDSLDAELKLNGDATPYYQTLKLRRDGYQMYYTTYSNEVERLKAYEADPEYRGYWIYHEYNMDGSPKHVRIIFDDTLNWTASDLIYVE